jgi:hypothetical protein
MGKIFLSRILSFLVLIIAAALCLQPVMAANNSISIAYRGAGGNYIGDTIIFDGYNSVGNITVLKLTGPGLPAGGVPVYDLNGKEGTGNPVEVNPDGSWRFAWYTFMIQNIDRMQTARYYITAEDLNDPTQSATTSILMKKPEFTVVASPNPLETGTYLQLLGTAERGTSDIRIDITDKSGKVLHTYSTAAGSSGYFNYGFHIDMQPGVYYITISSPSMVSTYRTILTVIPPQTPTPGVTEPASGNQSGALTSPGSESALAPGGVAAPSSAPQAPATVPAPLFEIVAGLCIGLIVVIGLLVFQKKNP